MHERAMFVPFDSYSRQSLSLLNRVLSPTPRAETAACTTFPIASECRMCLLVRCWHLLLAYRFFHEMLAVQQIKKDKRANITRLHCWNRSMLAFTCPSSALDAVHTVLYYLLVQRRSRVLLCEALPPLAWLRTGSCASSLKCGISMKRRPL